MKKIVMIMLIFLIYIINVNCVIAKTFECTYKQEDTKISSHWFKIKVNTDDKKVELLDHDGTSSATGLSKYNIDFIKNNWFSQKNSDTCLNTVLCYNGEDVTSGIMTKTNYNISVFFSLKEAKTNLGEDKIVEEHFDAIDTKKYRCVTYKKEDTTCDKYQKTKKDLKKYYSDYKKCSSSSCKREILIKIKEEKSIIKEYCNQILQHSDYGKECTSDCLDLNNEISELEKDTGINISDTGECGFSGRLMVWFSNILRWIKYLLPVVVIVLAILDFIKAIGADKDDEMKKAQGRFVKRLIAAALVFIIPLIIEFILDKMGFGYDDCGLF